MEKSSRGYTGSILISKRLVGVTALPVDGVMVTGIRRDGFDFEDTTTRSQVITFSDEAGLALLELLAEWKETL